MVYVYIGINVVRLHCSPIQLTNHFIGKGSYNHCPKKNLACFGVLGFLVIAIKLLNGIWALAVMICTDMV